MSAKGSALTSKLDIRTSRRTEMKNVTEDVRKVVRHSACTHGVCHLYVPHTTAAVMINEGYDPDVARDLEVAFDRLIPHQGDYRHAEGNSDSHIKTALVGSSETIWIADGHLVLGRWQMIFFAEFLMGRDSANCYVKIVPDHGDLIRAASRVRPARSRICSSDMESRRIHPGAFLPDQVHVLQFPHRRRLPRSDTSAAYAQAGCCEIACPRIWMSARAAHSTSPTAWISTRFTLAAGRRACSIPRRWRRLWAGCGRVFQALRRWRSPWKPIPRRLRRRKRTTPG